MTRPSLRTALAAGVLALAACNENTAPNPPGAAGNSVAVAPSFAFASNTWTKRARVPNHGPRMGLSAGVANNAAGQATLYVFGGNYDQLQWDDVQAYSYATNSWTSRGHFPETARSRANGVGRIGNRLYMSGGYDFSGGGGFGFESIRNTLYAYDPIANRVTRKADMPRHTAEGVTGVINNKLYVYASVCGYDCADRYIRRLYRYDPATNAWITLTMSPRFHIGAAGGAIRGKLYVAGGLVPFTGPTTHLDVYDPVTDKWTALAPMPEGRVYAAGTVVDNKLYVVGGLGPDAYGNASNTRPPEVTSTTTVCLGSCGRRSLFVYDPVTNTWKTKPSMPTPRYDLAAVSLPFDGQSHLAAVGGSQSAGDTTSSANEIYTP